MTPEARARHLRRERFRDLPSDRRRPWFFPAARPYVDAPGRAAWIDRDRRVAGAAPFGDHPGAPVPSFRAVGPSTTVHAHAVLHDAHAVLHDAGVYRTVRFERVPGRGQASYPWRDEIP